MGGGTSLIEAQRMGRNSIGIELQPDIARNSETLINIEHNDNCITKVITGDSRCYNINSLMEQFNIPAFQFVIMHLLIGILSNSLITSMTFQILTRLMNLLDSFGMVIDNTTNILQKNRYCACVIGDKYANSQVIPLGFYCMNQFLERGFFIKGYSC